MKVFVCYFFAFKMAIRSPIGHKIYVITYIHKNVDIWTAANNTIKVAKLWSKLEYVAIDTKKQK